MWFSPWVLATVLCWDSMDYKNLIICSANEDILRYFRHMVYRLPSKAQSLRCKLCTDTGTYHFTTMGLMVSQSVLVYSYNWLEYFMTTLPNSGASMRRSCFRIRVEYIPSTTAVIIRRLALRLKSCRTAPRNFARNSESIMHVEK